MSNLNIFIRIVISIILSFISCFIFTKKLIKKGKNKQIERNYLDSHLVKEGTVSGGGRAIYISTLLVFLLASIGIKYNNKIYALIFASSLLFLLGFLDDYFKNKYKSYKGISARVKLLIEAIILIYTLLILKETPLDLKSLNIPIIHTYINISSIYILFYFFVLVGCSNSLNLSDGLDGLAAGLVLICLSPFLLLSLVSKNYLIAIYLSSLLGSIMAFLYFNFHPAKIFMGDCGSLYLGGVLALVSIILRSEIILFISGFLFVVEASSVIIQVLFYKLRHKRVFLMTPIHHHFEKKGISEVRVVLGFYIVSIFLSIISLIVGVI